MRAKCGENFGPIHAGLSWMPCEELSPHSVGKSMKASNINIITHQYRHIGLNIYLADS
jgi:hypothetical protein